MGRIEILENKCKGCGLCITACPKKGLRFAAHLNIRGVNPPERITEIDCTGCTSCAIICPDCAIMVYKEKKREK
ncbi:MAG: 4Fe-4S dicluster domain-containing protein [Planctomycetota bacterium]